MYRGWGKDNTETEHNRQKVGAQGKCSCHTTNQQEGCNQIGAAIKQEDPSKERPN